MPVLLNLSWTATQFENLKMFDDIFNNQETVEDLKSVVKQ